MQIWQSATKFNQQQKSGVQYVALHLIAIRHRKCHHPQQAYPQKQDSLITPIICQTVLRTHDIMHVTTHDNSSASQAC